MSEQLEERIEAIQARMLEHREAGQPIYEERNVLIQSYYLEGHTLEETKERFTSTLKFVTEKCDSVLRDEDKPEPEPEPVPESPVWWL